MAESKQGLAKIPPGPLGKTLRVLFGLGTLYWISDRGIEELGLAGFAALLFLGVSFLLGGLLSNPGCELSAIPNLFLPEKEKVHFGLTHLHAPGRGGTRLEQEILRDVRWTLATVLI